MGLSYPRGLLEVGQERQETIQGLAGMTEGGQAAGLLQAEVEDEFVVGAGLLSQDLGDFAEFWQGGGVVAVQEQRVGELAAESEFELWVDATARGLGCQGAAQQFDGLTEPPRLSKLVGHRLIDVAPTVEAIVDVLDFDKLVEMSAEIEPIDIEGSPGVMVYGTFHSEAEGRRLLRITSGRPVPSLH